MLLGLVLAFLFGLPGVFLLLGQGRARQTITMIWLASAFVAELAYVYLEATNPAEALSPRDWFGYADYFATIRSGPVHPSTEYESGFSALTRGIAAVVYNPSVYLVVIVLIAMALLAVAIQLTVRADVGLAWFVYMNYPPFHAGATVILRQFVAVALVCVAVALLLERDRCASGPMDGKRKLLPAIACCVLAVMMHQSASTAVIVPLIMMFRVSTVLLLISNVVLFTFSRLGITELFLGAPGAYLTERQLVYLTTEVIQRYGSTSRLDFFAACIVPAAAVWVFGRYVAYAREDRLHIEACSRAMLSLCLPFSTFAFVAFSDRLAYYVWLPAPMIIISAMRNWKRGRTYAFGAFAVAAAIIGLLEKPYATTLATVARVVAGYAE